MIVSVEEKNVIAAAKEYPEAKNLLKKLFPEVFEDEVVFCLMGQLLKRKKYPKSFYSVQRINGKIKILNITNSSYWDTEIQTRDLKDQMCKRITLKEFKSLAKDSKWKDFKIFNYVNS